MARKNLRDLLSLRPEDTGELRWRTAVPICTNLFILFELFQFALVGASIVLLTLCTGVWFTEGSITATDIAISLRVAGMVLLAIMAGFICIAILFFRNRYFTIYHMDSNGIYHEGTRGRDERNEMFCLRLRPFPVVGAVTATRTRSRHLTWDKIDRFQDIPSMRVILLRRNFWHLLRLYTPGTETHNKVVQYLTERLQKKS